MRVFATVLALMLMSSSLRAENLTFGQLPRPGQKSFTFCLELFPTEADGFCMKWIDGGRRTVLYTLQGRLLMLRITDRSGIRFVLFGPGVAV